MSSLCPFAKAGTAAGGVCPMKSDKNDSGAAACPVAGKNHGSEQKERGPDGDREGSTEDPRLVPAKCPFGYDSNTLKLGPLSCMVCQALLHDASKCTPCTHKFCKACISRFKDCPLCGADVEGIEPDAELQALVDRFIDGHARIKRSLAGENNEAADGKSKVIYEDVSMERGAFLVQQAMRAFRAQNIESAKSRLSMCAEDIREELKSSQDNLDLCSQLGQCWECLGIAAGHWETLLRPSLTMKKVPSFSQNCPQMILSWSIRSQFRLIKLETFATMMGTSNLREVIMLVH